MGATAIEYALVAGLISFAIVGALAASHAADAKSKFCVRLCPGHR
ncbi:MAG: Flp family type IVb pilin [Rhizomicrobium sp.]